MQRRDLLKAGLATGLAMGVAPRLMAEDPEPLPQLMDWNRALVLIELRGGNDGLNTVVPYTDPVYYAERPYLAVAKDRVVRLTTAFGLHPNMEPLVEAWQAKDLAIIHGCGYHNPNRSHFRGIDIWNGGTDANSIAEDGWLARLLDQARQGSAPEDLIAHSIVWGHGSTVGHGGLGPLFGREHVMNLVMNKPEKYVAAASKVVAASEPAQTAAQGHVTKVQNDIVKCARLMDQALQKAGAAKGNFSKGRFSRHLQETARLIAGGCVLPVYKLTLDGFDTHAQQVPRHEKLLKELGDGLGAFRKACIAGGCWDRTLVMTYSEFGRRIAGNDSSGTDHGAAAVHFMMGGKVKGGMYGKPPGVGGGDIMATTDYRLLYTTVAREWWGFRGQFLKDRRINKQSLGIIEA